MVSIPEGSKLNHEHRNICTAYGSALQDRKNCTSGRNNSVISKDQRSHTAPITKEVSAGNETQQVSQDHDTRTDVPNAGANVPNAGANVPNAGANVPNAGANVPNAGANVPNTGADVNDTGANLHNIGHDLQNKDAELVCADSQPPQYTYLQPLEPQRENMHQWGVQQPALATELSSGYNTYDGSQEKESLDEIADSPSPSSSFSNNALMMK
ncbi:uncharacterized protein ACNLHF_005490, partial [Anomaloglossus baeobatrachus]|uniref:uncharacterized protein LOC142282322 n=1 Tax=Anomaloglossus baeobatrachus TaxID=238106 RepID=UPI003F5053C8